MAQRAPDLISRLADRGEEALQRVVGAPGAQRLIETLNGVRDRVDELQKRVRGIDALERRIEKLERRVEELAKARKPPARRAGTASGAARAGSATRRRAPKTG
jgi:ubiquinone biosynthesis protein UbiJ